MYSDVYFHGIGTQHLQRFISKNEIKLVETVLKSKYLLSLRQQGKTESFNFSGLDYISFCDSEKKHITNLVACEKPYYNAYNSYILHSISFAFDKKVIDKKYNVIIPNYIKKIKGDFYSAMREYGNQEERYSDLPDEVQIKDRVDLCDLLYVTYPCDDYLNSRLFLSYSSKRRHLLKEIKNLRKVLIEAGHDVDIYDIKNDILLDEKGVDNYISLKLYREEGFKYE